MGDRGTPEVHIRDRKVRTEVGLSAQGGHRRVGLRSIQLVCDYWSRLLRGCLELGRALWATEKNCALDGALADLVATAEN
jgi:hypothetical protein